MLCINQAIKSSTNKKLLNNAGLNTANRDALIPQVSNRLIFTQNTRNYVFIQSNKTLKKLYGINYKSIKHMFLLGLKRIKISVPF